MARALNGPRPEARFDGFGPGARSFVFGEPVGEVTARDVAEIGPALRSVEAAVREGLHAAGFLAYEAAPAFDPSLVVHDPRPDLPLLWFSLFRTREEVAPLGGRRAGEPDVAVGPWTPSLGPGEHARRVERIRRYIAAGDTYQVNLTFGLTAEYDGSDADLYRHVCLGQRAGYCALLRAPFGSIVSASPELFFRWAGRSLELRPMKGTRPRGRWPEEDRALAEELLDSPKERAENLMIVDLLRNDAGRVARFGTVHVPRLYTVERYPTVHQLTSTVVAETASTTTLRDILRALFPSGSVTGAPKVRTMEIIREVEDGPRGVYTGAVGFASPGEAVFNVPIRTLLLTGSGRVEMGVGSGITWDSDPAIEYRECLQKAEFVRERTPDFELLETILWEPGTGFHLLDGHLGRLGRSAEYFSIPLHTPRVLAALGEAVAGAGEPMRVRLLVDRDGAVRVEVAPLGATPDVLRTRLARAPVRSRDPLLFHKTTARGAYESRLAEHPGYDEVLLVNERGELTEFTTGNLVVVRDGAAVTPPLDSGVLPGVLRAALLESGELTEHTLTLADLRGAEDVYLINSVRGRIPVHVET